MNEEMKHPKTAEAALPSGTPSVPDVAEIEAAAEQMKAAIASFVQVLAKFELTTDLSSREVRLRGKAPVEFLAKAVDAVAGTSQLQAISPVGAEEGKASLALIRAIGSVETDTEGLLRRVRYANLVQKAVFGREMRQVYAHSKTLADGTGDQVLAAHVGAMKRAYRRPVKARTNRQPSSTPSSPTQ